MEYARIVLAKTNYQVVPCCRIIPDVDVHALNQIYYTYCRYKKFTSFMPIFDSQYTDKNNEVLGYYDNDKLVAFSLLRLHDQDNVEAIQFAWDYRNPKLRLGIKSLENECAIYKSRGFKFLYLGFADKYKTQFDGFETLGPI